MIKVVIDQERCVACASFYTLCDEVYQTDEAGTAESVEEYKEEEVFEGDVPKDIEYTKEVARISSKLLYALKLGWF